MLSDEEKKAIEFVKSELQDEKIARNDYQSLTGLYGNLEIETVLNIIEKQQKEIEELKAENKEIREWKYVIDNPIDLKKLSELDLIKIFGKSYISEDKIKAKIEEYKKQQKEEPDAYLCIKVLRSLLEKE